MNASKAQGNKTTSLFILVLSALIASSSQNHFPTQLPGSANKWRWDFLYTKYMLGPQVKPTILINTAYMNISDTYIWAHSLQLLWYPLPMLPNTYVWTYNCRFWIYKNRMKKSANRVTSDSRWVLCNHTASFIECYKTSSSVWSYSKYSCCFSALFPPEKEKREIMYK